MKCYPDPQQLSSTAGRLEQRRQHLETSAGGRADRCDGLRSYCTCGHAYDLPAAKPSHIITIRS